MAEVAAAPNTNQQVPLDTIPISPVDDSGESQEQESTSNNDEVRTVFHDPENFNVKHPLMNTWTLWFTKPPSGKVCYKLILSRRRFANRSRATTGLSC
jgi:translation initiation factor 4E